MLKIKDIVESSKNVQILVRVEKVNISAAANGSDYMSINLADDTGRTEARIWNCTNQDKDKIKVNGFYFIDGVVSKFKNVLQLKINNYKVVEKENLPEYGLSYDDFFLKAPIDIEFNYNNIVQVVNKIKNTTYSSICLKILNDNKEKFKSYPAAISIHHNVVGGLLWHTVSLLRNAIEIKKVYDYCDVDWELVYVGVILHDIGKVIEMNGIQASEYTLAGKLLGHISIGNTFIKSVAEELGLYSENNYLNEDVIKLQHLVLASHGKHEYGSPVEPQLIEAVIVSSLDDLDARMYKINDELSKINDNEFTGRIFSEDNRMYLKHKKK